MSTNIVHVMTIIGKAAVRVEAACEELLARRKPKRPKEYGSDDWSEADHRDIQGFCESLIKTARVLPVEYYAQYIDGWSTADSRFYSLEEWTGPWKIGRYIPGSNHGLVYYPPSVFPALLERIAKVRRRKVYRTQTEDRWYIDHLREAIDSAAWLKKPYLVLAISEVLGASRDDDEIKASMDAELDFYDPATRVLSSAFAEEPQLHKQLRSFRGGTQF